MQNHDERNETNTKRSFKASSLRIDPSLIAITCYLARIAADDDYDAFKNEQDSYNPPEKMGGPS